MTKVTFIISLEVRKFKLKSFDNHSFWQKNEQGQRLLMITSKALDAEMMFTDQISRLGWGTNFTFGVSCDPPLDLSSDSERSPEVKKETKFQKLLCDHLVILVYVATR